MKKQQKLSLGIALIAALCLLLGWFIITKKTDGKSSLLNEIEQVSQLTFFNGIEEFEFEKRDGIWVYLSDEEFPVYQEYLNRFAGAAAGLTGKKADRPQGELDVYGLDDPVFWVKVSNGTDMSRTIKIGDRITQRSSYGMIDGDDTVYIISSELGLAADCRLYDLVEIEAMPKIQEDTIQEITISKRGETYRLKKGESDEKTWKNMTIAISGLEIADCVNYKVKETQLKNYGLESPTGVVTVQYEAEGKMEDLTLIVGKPDAEGSYYYTKLKDSDAVNRVAGQLIKPCLYTYMEQEEKDE